MSMGEDTGYAFRPLPLLHCLTSVLLHCLASVSVLDPARAEEKRRQEGIHRPPVTDEMR